MNSKYSAERSFGMTEGISDFLLVILNLFQDLIVGDILV